MYVVWAIVGAIVGGLIGEGIPGACAGFAIGLLWGRLSLTRRELDELKARVGLLPGPATSSSAARDARDPAAWPAADAANRTVPRPADVSPAAGPQDSQRPPGFPAQAPDLPLSAGPVSAPGDGPLPPPMPGGPAPSVPPYARPATHAAAASASASASAPASHGAVPPPPPAQRPFPFEPAGPSAIERFFDTAKRWFTEGNVPVKVGMLVLFAGVAAFLKYASDQGLLHVPVSVRLSIVALAAIAGVAFGWWQRDTRRAFALSLQGGALGVLVMTVFAAYRLYGLIDALPTFVLLVIFVGSLGVLAVVQDSLALAVLGLIAGFAAPILASSGHGNHVALFSYYAVLNLGIFAIAWKRAWRVLNVLGFVATFGVGTAWGVLGYRPEFFNSTEPFLVLFFLLYVAVPWLHVLRSPRRDRAILDGCLMFGTPIVSLLLQGALLDWKPMPIAMSALVAAALYVAIAFAVRKREDMGLLRETWAVLAVAFATTAIPLALSASVTACIFALEGAGLVWLGFRQQRRLPRWSGIFLQLASGVAWTLADFPHAALRDIPFVNAYFVGAMLITAGGVACLWQYDRHSASKGIGSLARGGLLLWSVTWWLLGFGSEVDHFVLADAPRWAAFMALFGVTGWVLAVATRYVRKLDLGVMLAGAVPLAFVAMIAQALYADSDSIQVFMGWPLLAVAVAGVSAWFSLRALVAHDVVAHGITAVAAETLWWGIWLALAYVGTHQAFGYRPGVGDGWQVLAYVAPVLLLTKLGFWVPSVATLPLSVGVSRAGRAPTESSIGTHVPGMNLVDAVAMARRVIALGGLSASVVIGVMAACVDGSAQPLPFIPVLNPLELVLVAVFGLIARALWDAEAPVAFRRVRPAILAVAFFIIATSMTLRAVHHLGGVPWDERMGNSSLAELSLTIVWSVIGVVAWVLGSRRGQRLLWIAGAACMGIVLAKLLLVDRGHLGNLFGIASFIAYGLLCTVIGYLAPAPPRQAPVEPEESPHAS